MIRVFIIGDAPLVEEYASLCLNKSLGVSGRVNSGQTLPKPPKGISKSSKPSRSTTIGLELTNLSREQKRTNLRELESKLSPTSTIVSSSVTVTVAEQASWLKSQQRLVGIGALPSLLRGSLIELAKGPATDSKHLANAQSFVDQLGKQSSVVGDSVGMVLPRIVCALANEAFFAMKEQVAGGREIDTAMKLGTNYPQGPVEWAGIIGARHVCAVMQALFASFGEERYRPAPLLQQHAML